jgi:hypothetical protein
MCWVWNMDETFFREAIAVKSSCPRTRTTNVLSLEHGFWKWSSNQKSEATESWVLLLQPRIYLVFENKIKINGAMVQYVVTKLSGNLDYKFANSRRWILEVKLQPKIWGNRKLHLTSATSNLSRFWKSDQYWWRYGPICGDKIEWEFGLQICRVWKMDFGSEAPTKNRRRQRVGSYFCNLESISFLKIKSILMEIWPDMWWQNWVGTWTTNLPTLEDGFWKWSSNQKSEATESCILLLQARIYLVFENQINIEGDMVQYAVTKLSRDLDYCTSVRSAPTGGSNTAWAVHTEEML